MKEKSKEWVDGMSKNITFIVTKDCQLACKYCYLVGKNTRENMTWEVAKTAIDYILSHESDFREESVVWDFIGGEPFLEIDLIDRICDYLKTEMFRLNHIIGSTPTVSRSPQMGSIMIQKKYRI